ncbi:MAG TPA: DUF3011 domain-containing protein [Terriglobales bacterium]|nr:DUF3011 domain-containing protein [Terriglobales bacterium]
MDTSTKTVVPETTFNHTSRASGLSAKLALACVVALISFCASVPAFAQYGLTCASEDGHRHYCSADTRGGVTMQHQRSKSACVQGASWGFDQRGVWVDHGCRADFIVNTRQVDGPGDRDRDHFHGHDADDDRDGDRDRDHDREGDRDRDRDRGYDRDHHDHDWDRDRRPAETMQLTCASEDGRRHYCQSDIQGTATLLRQRSGSPCREGYSWGNDRNGIWVDHGCRADFQLEGRRTAFVGNPGYIGSLKCSSDFGTRQYCGVETRGRVRIARQISESACRLGYSWGYDANGVWVDHGCRAEFQIGN